MDSDLQEKIALWKRLDKTDATIVEVEKLIAEGNESELRKIMMKRIAFGTAGLRGAMRAGFANMNLVTVTQASQGLADYLIAQLGDGPAQERGVAIGYDGRYNSLAFAQATAATFLFRKFKVYFYTKIVATPLVPYCVQQNNCCAGVMVTASHNPKNDNGFKVYWGTGCQIIPPHDEGIAASIEATSSSLWEGVVFDETDTNLIDPIKKDDLENRYFSDITKDHAYTLDNNANATAKIVYTAMHGVGAPFVARAFEAFGLPPYVPVVEQIEANPDFPTVAFPNPEEGKGALTLAMATADAAGSNIIFANDPDADRLAVAERNATTNEWRVFSGNELGALLGVWVWQQYTTRHPDFDKTKGLMIASTVSSKFLKRVGEVEGFQYDEALTGFKWIGHRAIALQEEKGLKFIFGFEEAIGFMIGDNCWDKDGVRAAAVFAELYNSLLAKGVSLSEQLESLYVKYGRFLSKVHYFFCYEPAVMAEVFDRLRKDGRYPAQMGKYAISGVRDLTTGYDSHQPDGLAVLPVDAKSHMITFTFENNCVITLRGSGTEPKLKYYVELFGSEDAAVLQERLDDMVATLIETFLEPERNNLVKPRE